MHKPIEAQLYLNLRWFALLGQLIILALAVLVFKLTLPWPEILMALALIPCAHLIGLKLALLRGIGEVRLVGGLLAFDTLVLTLVLALAGGPTNPFTIVFLLHVVLSSVLLNTAWTWAITALSSVGFASLFVYSWPVPEWHHHDQHQAFSLHLHGMLFAYVAVATLVAYYLNRIVSDLREKEIRLERLGNIEANQQKLAALTAVSAGVAHELGTPLGTIAVVSHELERTLKQENADSHWLEDVALIKSETMRCKSLLQELSAKSGDLLGESPVSVSVEKLIEDAIAPLKIRAAYSLLSGATLIVDCVPSRALSLALRSIFKNAIEACGPSAKPIEIRAALNSGNLSLEIKDFGPGISKSMLERVGEPFFSTKGQAGMGLGIYLCRLTMEQLGGSLSISSQPGSGTIVSLRIPQKVNLEQAA